MHSGMRVYAGLTVESDVLNYWENVNKEVYIKSLRIQCSCFAYTDLVVPWTCPTEGCPSN